MPQSEKCLITNGVKKKKSNCSRRVRSVVTGGELRGKGKHLGGSPDDPNDISNKDRDESIPTTIVFLVCLRLSPYV